MGDAALRKGDVAVVGMPDTMIHLYAAAFLFHLVLVHGVLKWLHHPLLKYVMLLHPVVV